MTALVRSNDCPSRYVPIAEIWLLYPAGIKFRGVFKAIESRLVPRTTTGADASIPLKLVTMFVCPDPTKVTKPELETVATPVFCDDQVTASVMSDVDLSE